MKKRPILAILLITVTANSFFTGCATISEEETQSLTGTSTQITQFEEFEELNDYNRNSNNPEYQYYIGDHQILTHINTNMAENAEFDGEIPSDFDTRYADQPMLVELAHEYAQLGDFYDYYTSATMHEQTGDGITINGGFYYFLHGFIVEVTDGKYDEERYCVTLMPEELALDIYGDNESLTETDYGFSIINSNADEINAHYYYEFSYHYYTDSHLLVSHYIFSTDIG